MICENNKNQNKEIWHLVFSHWQISLEIRNFILSFNKIERNKLFQTRSSCKDCNHNGMTETETNIISDIIVLRFHEFIKKFFVTIRLELL